MFGRSRRESDAAQSKIVEPWAGDALRAEWSLQAVGRRKQVPCVVLSGPDFNVRMLADDVRRLVKHTRSHGVVDSVVGDRPMYFLCWPDTASPDSPAYKPLDGLPLDSLALLVETTALQLAAVMPGPTVKSFTAWVLDLPR